MDDRVKILKVRKDLTVIAEKKYKKEEEKEEAGALDHVSPVNVCFGVKVPYRRDTLH